MNHHRVSALSPQLLRERHGEGRLATAIRTVHRHQNVVEPGGRRLRGDPAQQRVLTAGLLQTHAISIAQLSNSDAWRPGLPALGLMESLPATWLTEASRNCGSTGQPKACPATHVHVRARPQPAHTV